MMFRVNRLATGLMLMGCAPFASAAGFALIEQNVSGLGNAYAGQAAAATDASTIFFNPAGMTLLPDRQVVMAGHLIKPQTEFAGTATPNNGGGQGGDAGDPALVPNGYFAFRLTPDVHLGIGMSAPFGLKTEYDSGWIGSNHAVKSELKTINLNPSIAWKASPSLSLGAGLSLQYVKATLTNTSPAGLATVKGDDYGWGFNLGALWQINPATRIGLAYRSEVEYTLEGTVAFSGVPVLNGPVTADATMPDSASLSLFHKVNTRWDLLADVTWTGWSDFDELRIVRTTGAVVGVTPENWRDTWRYSVGANYHYSNTLTLRGGVAFDQRAASDEFRTARIPDEDRTWLAFGAQYRMSERSRIDVGYAHLFVKDARLNKTEGGVSLTGTYEGSVDIVSAQLTVDF